MKDIYLDLVAALKHHNYLYHVVSKPEISDENFNSLVEITKNMEANHPHIMVNGKSALTVGGKPDNGLNKVTFDIPMLSMDNRYTIDEFRNFFDGSIISLEPKVDGLALTIIYRNGIMSLAHTRGDGTVGEDVTEQVRVCQNIPNNLTPKDGVIPPYLEVRGEVYLSYRNFAIIQNELKAKGLPLFKTARNAVAGTIRTLDLDVVKHRAPEFVAYGIGRTFDSSIATQTDLYDKLESFGIPAIGKYSLQCAGSTSIAGFIEAYEANTLGRTNLPFEIDGMVGKIDSLKDQRFKGSTSRVPLWCVAYKYPSTEVITPILGVTWGMSYSGAYTPVAKLDPVTLGGVVVSNATLNNITWLKELGVRVRDFVTITRGGEVIPKITGIAQANGGAEIEIPTKCRYCYSDLAIVNHRPTCTNRHCAERNKLHLMFAVTRDCLNIRGIGPETIEDLCSVIDADGDCSSAVVDLADLLNGNWIDTTTLTGKNQKAAINKLIRNPLALWRAYMALGIPDVGKSLSKTLAGYKTIMELVHDIFEHPERTLKELCELPLVGEVTAKGIINFFLVFEPSLEWLELVELAVPEKGTCEYSGKTFVLTGTAPDGMSREAGVEYITSLGGKVSGSVSRKTTAVIFGANAGSKYDKAEELGVETIPWVEFFKL